MTDLKVRDTREIPRSLVRIEWVTCSGPFADPGRSRPGVAHRRVEARPVSPALSRVAPVRHRPRQPPGAGQHDLSVHHLATTTPTTNACDASSTGQCQSRYSLPRPSQPR